MERSGTMKGWVRYFAGMAAGGLLLLWLFALPGDLFEGVSYSTVVTDRRGELLGARVADDGQWRFPPCDTLPEKFCRALVEFEDRTFYTHPGVSLRALGRAAWQNLRNGRIVSGGSTLTMQVIRLSRRKPRTIGQKLIEIFLATRLEARCTKREILRLYASHAPFGGNVVGIEAAMWRYLGHGGADLSWAEAATLAVLQNAPATIHPGHNRKALLAKRNRLLERLRLEGCLSKQEYELAVDEPLIGAPRPMPQQAPHLVEWYDLRYHGKRIMSDIDLPLQRRVEELTTRWNRELRLSGIRDLAAVIVEVRSGRIIALCGNSDLSFNREGMWVDIARAPRSSGSILKPLLYAAALQEGIILPRTLLADVPTDFAGFAPRNFDGSYSGVVPADEALIRSLNVPNVGLLKKFGVARFASWLRRSGFTSLGRRAETYGLSLILGGAEVTLIDIVRCYARMAACYLDPACDSDFPLHDRVALYRTFEALREVERPDQMDWRRALSVRNVAWKTGTSYGSRDAWAAGVTPEYAVGVWAGNADGSGVADLTGARVAGPILFDLFALLPRTGWFAAPDPVEGVRMSVCLHSGHLAGPYCSLTEEQQLPARAQLSDRCPYCREIAVSLDGTRRVVDRSEPARIERLFLLPPLEEHYYRPGHPDYRPLPPPATKEHDLTRKAMHFLYPTPGCVLSLPRQIDGSPGRMTCQVAHRDPSTELFWHLDAHYLGATRDLHRMSLTASEGVHRLTVVDPSGDELTLDFVIVNQGGRETRAEP